MLCISSEHVTTDEPPQCAFDLIVHLAKQQPVSKSKQYELVLIHGNGSFFLKTKQWWELQGHSTDSHRAQGNKSLRRIQHKAFTTFV